MSKRTFASCLGDAAASALDIPGADGMKDLVVAAPTANEDIIQTQPIGLDDPDLDGSTTLLGGGAGTDQQRQEPARPSR